MPGRIFLRRELKQNVSLTSPEGACSTQNLIEGDWTSSKKKVSSRIRAAAADSAGDETYPGVSLRPDRPKVTVPVAKRICWLPANLTCTHHQGHGENLNLELSFFSQAEENHEVSLLA